MTSKVNTSNAAFFGPAAFVGQNESAGDAEAAGRPLAEGRDQRMEGLPDLRDAFACGRKPIFGYRTTCSMIDCGGTLYEEGDWPMNQPDRFSAFLGIWPASPRAASISSTSPFFS
jgi:hypothetical protein